MPTVADPSQDLLPAVATWFREALGTPTAPQRAAWPAIAAGQHTLIAAPTGSGKTLAAFLACLDYLWRHPERPKGVGILYISPLKALNEDIARNLVEPLRGILAVAQRLGSPLPPLTVGVRTGDTPTADRQRMARKPPDILITTPESLHLLLTSKARDTLRHVSHVLVDEIHALCPNKRGVFLALLLERLESIRAGSFLRVGMSATQRPLEEVARYLGGRRLDDGAPGRPRFEPRPVTIVDAGVRKELDLQVVTPPGLGGPMPGGTVWPAIEEQLASWIGAHRSTIVFANNRRLVERLTTRLNEREDAATGDEPRQIARSHHGSLSLEQRRQTEELLKQGELPAVVATASLELGIDMGAVDLVAQVESPGGVSRGLQRVGRAGHIVGSASKGRLVAKTCGDLVEMAALARAMTLGEVEALRVPTACLDVLAQQIIACVAMDRWEAPALFDLVRGAHSYRDLPAAAFERVLEMVSGRFGLETFRDLKPRISWDRIHNRLHPLPGTAQLALVGGGAIPDTGCYPLYLGEGGPRLGELDEEFVLERRVGETFVLGTATWRIESIDPLRVIVSRAEGRSAMMPFWRGEAVGRTAALGEAVGALCRELTARLDDPGVLAWLTSEHHLEPRAARVLLGFVARQLRVAGVVPDDRTVLVETFRDPSGELGLAVLTPFGARFHLALKLALQARLRQRLGIAVASLHDDDAILIRLPGTDEPPRDLFEGLTADRAEALIRAELPDSALFGLRFRQNAGRALLMPRPDPSKRTPLWLQRLRAKDLLQVVRQVPDFPIVVETLRECLDDDLELPRLRTFLDRIQAGTIQVVTRQGEIPSPFASEVIFKFTNKFLYEWDEPKRGDVAPVQPESRGLLDTLVRPEDPGRWLDPAAIVRVEGRLRSMGQIPRTVDEMAEWLRRLGDLTVSEPIGPMGGFLDDLAAQGRAARIELAGTVEPSRWIATEELALYRDAFEPDPPGEAALERIVRRYFETHALVGLDDLLDRYPIDPALATALLERWADAGCLVRVEAEGDDASPRWVERRNLDEVRRLSIALKRRESVAVSPEAFADFLVRHHGVHPETRREGSAAVGLVLDRLQGFAAPAELWESELLPRRVRDFRPAWLDAEFGGGGWVWRAEGDRVAFYDRERVLSRSDAEAPEWESDQARVLEHLQRRGASFATEIAMATGLTPLHVRAALEALARRGAITNDRFDPLRAQGKSAALALAEAAGSATSRRSGLGSHRRGRPDRPEGRWSELAGPSVADEEALRSWVGVLLDRHVVLCRETAALDPWAPPWRDLFPVLDRAELRGEVRRGYFVEGLSGVQFALDESAHALSRQSGERRGKEPPCLLATLDPANLYGSGAPFDIPLLAGGTARLVRSAANFVVLVGGRPVLILEAYGRRLTGLASASADEHRAALALMPSLAGPSRRILKVETYNGIPTLQSPAADWLAEAGLVRDPPGMAYYAGW